MIPDRTKYEGPARAVHDFEHLFVAPMDAQFDVLKSVLDSPELADKEVVLLADPGMSYCEEST